MIKNSVYGIYFARCMNILLVKYDVHTTLKINSIHAIFYHILSLSICLLRQYTLSNVCHRTSVTRVINIKPMIVSVQTL